MPGNEVELTYPEREGYYKLTEKERKLINLMRELWFFKIEVHGEYGEPIRVINIKKNIRL